jgi:hypothetical protein
MSNFLSTYASDFVARFDGPLHFRLIMQPLMAVLFAIRDGTRDARQGKSAYFWSLLIDPVHRSDLLKDGWKGISKVFVLAYLLDVVYQLLEWHGLKPMEALLTAVILAVLPYVLLRGPVNRLIRAWHRRVPARHA